MKSIIKNVIDNGGYKLAEVQRKIKKAYAWGDITEADADELLAMAANNISVEGERPDVSVSLAALSERIDELAKRIDEIAGGDVPEGYPKWKPWDGNSKDYVYGAIVEHKDKLWLNILVGMQNTWEPGAQGTEAIWTEYKA